MSAFPRWRVVYNSDHVKDTRTSIATVLRRKVRSKKINDLFEILCVLFFLKKNQNHIYLFVYLFVCVYKCGDTLAHVWQSENNIREFIHYFYHVGYGNQTQVIVLCGKSLFLLSHVACLPSFSFLPPLLSEVFCPARFPQLLILKEITQSSTLVIN